jgi:nucleoside-diphosphate-sugar epimerase
VNDFVYQAKKEKTIVLYESHFKRNYIHVDDVARVFVYAINNFDRMKGEVYNVGLSSANLSKLELCEKIKECVPELTILQVENKKDPDQRNYIVSNEKLESLGWKPKYTLDDGIQQLLKAYEVIGNVKGRFSNV